MIGISRRYMIAHSPIEAATEGFRVIRRAPGAVMVWALMWLVWFSVAAGIVATGEKVVVSNSVAHWTIWDIFRHYGPFAVVLVALFFVVLGMTAIASFRAVLNPEQKRFFYLRLGRDELRVAAISVMAFSLVAIFGGVPAAALIALADPIMAAAPTLARQIGGARRRYDRLPGNLALCPSLSHRRRNVCGAQVSSQRLLAFGARTILVLVVLLLYSFYHSIFNHGFLFYN